MHAHAGLWTGQVEGVLALSASQWIQKLVKRCSSHWVINISLFLVALSTEISGHADGGNPVRLWRTGGEAVETNVRTSWTVHYSLSYEYFIVFTTFHYRNFCACRWPQLCTSRTNVFWGASNECKNKWNCAVLTQLWIFHCFHYLSLHKFLCMQMAATVYVSDQHVLRRFKRV